MRIAVVGATGRIGAKLTRTLLGAGHQVKALSRGGPALDVERVRSGAVTALDAGVSGVKGLAHLALELLLGVRADDLAAQHEVDVTAAFFCDVLTLVRGDPPRPLPLWF